MANLTAKEQLVMDEINAQHDYDIDYGPTLEDLRDVIALPIESLRGVLGTLEQKNMISVDKDYGIPTCYTSVEACSDYASMMKE